MPKDKEKDIEENKLIAYLHEELNDKERLEVEAWLAECPQHEKLYKETCNAYYAIQWTLQEKTVHTAQARKRLQRIWQKRRLQYKNYAIAAICILLLCIGSTLLWEKTPSQNTPEIQVAQSDKQPKVTLLLADGSEIILDEKKEATIINKDRLKVTTDSIGQLHYTSRQEDIETEEIRYNTLIVPRGNKHTITLSDGTKIWLSADSHFEYPESFSANYREVKLKGEAYFEVAKDSLRPFIVHSGEYKMQVYGTEFNLNTHDEQQIQLVLVNGSVGFKANASVEEVRLQPGQLGEANCRTGENSIRKVNVTHYTAWKDGYVIFQDERLESIMEKIARWYNVEVFFESEDLKNVGFYGNLKIYEDLQEFLNYLGKASDAHFKVKGRTIVIGKK